MRDEFLHGGALDIMQAKYPMAPTPWIDLSTGINPWPYLFEDISPAMIHHLPTQATYLKCRKAMANAMGTMVENVLLSAGSEILIRLLPVILSPKRVVVLSPSYGDHARVWRAAECEVIETTDPLSHASDADMIVLCNPNNPDGRLFKLSALEQVRVEMAARGGWLVVDEAYADLDPQCSLTWQSGTQPSAAGLIILRSLGKFYGLAGLRLGAMIAPSNLRDEMSQRLGVWNISGPALEVATQAYQDLPWQVETRSRLADACERLDNIFRRVGIQDITGTNLYRYIRHERAQQMWELLAHKGIYVRRFSDRPLHLRFGLPPDAASEARLYKALSSCQ